MFYDQVGKVDGRARKILGIHRGRNSGGFWVKKSPLGVTEAFAQAAAFLGCGSLRRARRRMAASFFLPMGELREVLPLIFPTLPGLEFFLDVTIHRPLNDARLRRPCFRSWLRKNPQFPVSLEDGIVINWVVRVFRNLGFDLPRHLVFRSLRLQKSMTPVSADIRRCKRQPIQTPEP